LHTVLKEWGVMDKKFLSTKRLKEMKVEDLASKTSSTVHYEHGNSSLEKVIFIMGYDFVGTNNMPYLQRKGQFGSRRKGGKDTPAPRYAFTCPEPWLHYMYHKIDMELIPDRVEDGEVVEKQFFLPIIPMVLA